MSREGDRMFVVRRITRDEVGLEDIPEPKDQYVAAFAAAEDAEAFARRRDREHIAAHRPLVLPSDEWPFREGFAAVTSLPEPVLRDWLLDHDIPPPAKPKRPTPPPKKARGETAAEYARAVADHEAARFVLPWLVWWEETVVAGKLPPEKVAVVWQALDRARFFEVAEVEGPVPAGVRRVFAVVRKYWEYNDMNYSGANDVVSAYRTRRAATEAMQEKAAAAAEAGDDEEFEYPPDYEVIELPVSPGAAT